MKILLVNDDGYSCQGIIKLATALSKEHEVLVVAPNKCNSGMSHAMTFGKTIYLKKREGFPYECYSVTGTPADCVKLGMEISASNPPDVVISGINTDLNIGTDVVYSGTANAALEAVLEDVPSIALSVKHEVDEDYDDVIEDFLASFEYVLSLVSTEYALNINYPNKAQKKGEYVLTKLGKRKFTDVYIVGAEEDAKGIPHSLVGTPLPVSNDDDCDVVWYEKGYTTITPLTMDRTNFNALKALKARKGDS